MSETHSAGNGWNVWSKYVLAELKRAGRERDRNHKDLEKFIEKTFGDFLKEEYRPLEKRLVKAERVIWALGGAWVIFVAIMIWGIQQLLTAS
jgi:hypothetical protein